MDLDSLLEMLTTEEEEVLVRPIAKLTFCFEEW